jgi:hypothetical protein
VEWFRAAEGCVSVAVQFLISSPFPQKYDEAGKTINKIYNSSTRQLFYVAMIFITSRVPAALSPGSSKNVNFLPVFFWPKAYHRPITEYHTKHKIAKPNSISLGVLIYSNYIYIGSRVAQSV